MPMVTITDKALKDAVSDPRYWKPYHPDYEGLRRWVQDGFKALYPEGSDDTGGERQVQVRAYTRVVDGKVQHVGSYTQTRDGAGEIPLQHSLNDAPPGTGPLDPPVPTPKPVVIMIGGAGDQTFSGIVEGFADRLLTANPGAAIHYFAADQQADIEALIASLPEGTQVSLVGHSWGADTAAEVAAKAGRQDRPITLLVTVDTVGRGVTDGYLRQVRDGTIRWINVNAVGGTTLNLSNVIAGLGGPYGQAPQRFADTFLAAPYAHNRFGEMLNLKDPNRPGSILETILGR